MAFMDTTKTYLEMLDTCIEGIEAGCEAFYLVKHAAEGVLDSGDVFAMCGAVEKMGPCLQRLVSKGHIPKDPQDLSDLCACLATYAELLYEIEQADLYIDEECECRRATQIAASLKKKQGCPYVSCYVPELDEILDADEEEDIELASVSGPRFFDTEVSLHTDCSSDGAGKLKVWIEKRGLFAKHKNLTLDEAVSLSLAVREARLSDALSQTWRGRMPSWLE